MKKHLSLSQRIHNAEGAQMVEYLHGMHEYLHASNSGKEEYGVIWSKRDDVSWAHGFGRWRGMEDMWYAHVNTYIWRGIKNYYNLIDTLPEATYLDDFRGLCEVAMHVMANDIIEVADDGQSARGYFVTPGHVTNAATQQAKFSGGFLWERYGADFVYEEGEWKYLHEHVCPDIGGSLDVYNVGVETYQALVKPKAPAPDAASTEGVATGGGTAFVNIQPTGEMARLSEPGPLHNNYTPVQTVQNTVPWPEPYTTLDEDHTYTKKKVK